MYGEGDGSAARGVDRRRHTGLRGLRLCLGHDVPALFRLNGAGGRPPQERPDVREGAAALLGEVGVVGLEPGRDRPVGRRRPRRGERGGREGPPGGAVAEEQEHGGDEARGPENGAHG